MKNIKIIAITAIVSFGLSIGIQTFGAFMVNFSGTKIPANTENKNTKLIQPVENKLSIQEQLTKGNMYDIYTGKKLVAELSDTELRFQAIEKRLNILEAKK